MTSPVCPTTFPCKICGAPAPLMGVVDLNRNCLEREGVRLPLAGVPVYYRRCPRCAFIFTEAFDGWSRSDFLAHIYNDEYITVDPGYCEARPRANVDLIIKIFGARRGEIACLDYGGGNGALAAALRAAGFARAENFDEFNVAFDRMPEGRFNLVSCFEVFEHVTEPRRVAAQLARIIGEDGLMLFSTLIQPPDIDAQGIGWWYLGPRNGHISLHSRQSLRTLLNQVGLRFGSFNDNLHAAYRSVPAYAAHVIRPKAPAESGGRGHAPGDGPKRNQPSGDSAPVRSDGAR